jgi:2-succinyl-6-hydroxy-2,4-cyclohexadiene-1-carboxylate synthase
MKEKRIKTNGIELQIRDWEQDAESIIFLHFSGANLMMWQPVLPTFRDQYRIVLVDLRGHGKSDRPEDGYHMDEMARDVMGVMEGLQLEQAHVVGSSLGAEVGLALAANHPDKVISLVCDGALSSEFGPYGTWEGTEAEFQDHVAAQLEGIRDRPQSVFPSVDALVDSRREIFEKYIAWNEAIEAVERYGATKIGAGRVVPAFGKQAMLDYMAHYFQYRLEDYYASVKCPLLMLPDQDALENEREVGAMRGLAALAEQAEILEVSGWDHPYGWLLDPGPISQAISAFLSAVAQ